MKSKKKHNVKLHFEKITISRLMQETIKGGRRGLLEDTSVRLTEVGRGETCDYTGCN
ncbi:hypothetical protein ACWGOQ_0021010 [Aquimarina sp. M1]